MKFAYIERIQAFRSILQIFFDSASQDQPCPKHGNILAMPAMPGANDDEKKAAAKVLLEEQPDSYVVVDSLAELQTRAQAAANSKKKKAERKKYDQAARQMSLPRGLRNRYLRLGMSGRPLGKGEMSFFNGEAFVSSRIKGEPVFYATAGDKYVCAECATRICQHDIIAVAIPVRKRTERALTCDLCKPDKAATFAKVALDGVRLYENTVVFGKEEILLYNRYWKHFHDLGYEARYRDTTDAQYHIEAITDKTVVLYHRGKTSSIEHTQLALLYTMDNSYAEEAPPALSNDPELALRQQHACSHLWWRPGEKLLTCALPWRDTRLLWYESVSQKDFPKDTTLPQERQVLCNDCATRSLMDKTIPLWPIGYTGAGGDWGCGTCGTTVHIPIVLSGGEGYGEGFHSRD